MNPELNFQRYQFDHDTFGEIPGLQREVVPFDESFLDTRKMPHVMAEEFLEGKVLQAMVTCDVPVPEVIRLIKEIDGEPQTL